MRTSFVSILAVASTFTGVFSAPTNKAAEISVRQEFDALPVVTELKESVLPNIASIQSTAESVSASSTDEEKAAAEEAISQEVATIVATIDAALAQFPPEVVPAADATSGLSSISKRDIEKRQSAAIFQQISAILNPLSAASDAIIASLGLSTAQSLLGPLGPSLSRVLISLRNLLNDVLELVQQLLNNLLTGLSAGLIGIVIPL